MGYGAMCNRADTVETDFVKGICPTEYAALDAVLNENKVSWDELADAAWNGDSLNFVRDNEGKAEIAESYEEKIDRLLRELYVAFQKQTGLSLYLIWHNAEDRYDEIDGVAWGVEGVYQLSEAGKKWTELGKITPCSWVVYG